ncbi:MAG: ABC transporter permease subunit [Terrimesophilobacter sp.]
MENKIVAHTELGTVARPRFSETWIRRLTLLASFILLLAAWYAISLAVGSIVLPTPVETVEGIANYYSSGNLWPDLAITLSRVLATLALAFAISVLAGIALARSKWVDRLFGAWVAIFSSIPALMILLVVYLGVGLNDNAAVIGTAIVVVPSMTYGVWQGMDSLQPELSEMAQVFGLSQMLIVRKVLLPQTWPFLFANIRQGLSLTWKIMVFAEILGLSAGVGFRMQYWFQLFNMQQVLASALPFMVVMMALEYLVLRPGERYLFRWKKAKAQ